MNKGRVRLGPRPTPPAAGYPPLSRQRLAVLDFIRGHAPARVSEVATGLGLHVNTVREHLDELAQAGLVDTTTEAPAGRGRPATLYQPAPADPAVGAQDYAGLATALAGHLARTSAHPEADARAAGIDWGRELVGSGDDGNPDPHTRVIEILARLGFGPQPCAGGDEPGIALRTCPLLDAARRYPTVVCQVHLGLVEGMLDALGARTGPGLDLIAFAEPGACRLFLPDPDIPGGTRDE